MKELKLNLDNLNLLGATDKIIGEDFKNWIINNGDIYIDFDNEIIHTGFIDFFEGIDVLIELEKQDLSKKGYSNDEIELSFRSSYDEAKTIFDDLFKHLPDKNKSAYSFEILLKIRDKFLKYKSDYLDKKVDLILGLDSVSDKLKPMTNPYPKIFKDYKSYTIFRNLLDEFGNTKENLSNYSFVFHKMTYEDMIHCDLKHQAYFRFLDEFDISISRIKSLGAIGKILSRESIYAKAK